MTSRSYHVTITFIPSISANWLLLEYRDGHAYDNLCGHEPRRGAIMILCDPLQTEVRWLSYCWSCVPLPTSVRTCGATPYRGSRPWVLSCWYSRGRPCPHGCFRWEPIWRIWTRKLIGTAMWPSSLGMLSRPSPHHCSPIGRASFHSSVKRVPGDSTGGGKPCACTREETLIQAVVGSIVWAIRMLERDHPFSTYAKLPGTFDPSPPPVRTAYASD